MNSYNSINIIIKEAIHKDVYELRQCNKACLPVYYPYGYYNQIIDSNRHIIIVAKHNEEVIGYIIGEASSDVPDRFHIISFGVKKEFRKQNIGSYLMNKIIEISEKRFFNIKRISLYVMASNQIAIKFYEKHGFFKQQILKKYYESFNQDGYLYIKNIRQS